MKHIHPSPTGRLGSSLGLAIISTLLVAAAHAQTSVPPAAPATPHETHYLPAPSFDTSAMDLKTDPCDDFYKFACGNYAANNPIPADQTGTDQFHSIHNVDNQELNGILKRYAAPDPDRTPNQQKIGDYYAACMNVDLIEKDGLTPIQPLLKKIDKVSKLGLPYLAGEFQRDGVNVFFSLSELQDFKDSSKQIAVVVQAGLGLPERDYYLRTGDKDKQIRDQYVAHITTMLTLGGERPRQAAIDAASILGFETKLAAASLPVTEMRDPDALYHPQTIADFETIIKSFPLQPFLEGIHAPKSLPGPLGPNSLVDMSPKFFPAMVQAIQATSIEALRAYIRFHLLSTYASDLPKRFDEESFDFYGRKLNGQPEQRPRWKRCSSGVDGALGEALGQVWSEQ